MMNKRQSKQTALTDLHPDTLLSQSQAAWYLGKSTSWLEKERQNGKYGIPYYKIGHNVRYKVGDLIEFIASARRQYWDAAEEPYMNGGSSDAT